MLHARSDYTERIVDIAGLIPEEEPVFLLRGQDLLAPNLLVQWAEEYERLGGDPAVAESVQRHARRMADWQLVSGKAKIADVPLGVLPAGVQDQTPGEGPEGTWTPDPEIQDSAIPESSTSNVQVEPVPEEHVISLGRELYEESFRRVHMGVDPVWESLPTAAQRQWIEQAREELNKAG